MNEHAPPAASASLLSSEAFENLLLRASLNFRFRDTLNEGRRRDLVYRDSSPIGETAGLVWQALAQRGPRPSPA
jgi:hypothetical protein